MAARPKVVTQHRGLMFIALEFVAIVFGVFLGGFLADRRSERELSDLVERSREAIYAELRINYDELSRARAYHLERYKDFSALARGNAEPGPVYARMTQGFSVPQIQTGAYDAAVAAGLVVYFDTEEFAQISRGYSVANINDGMSDIYVSALVNDRSGGERIPSIMVGAFRQFMIGDEAALEVMAPLVGENAPTSWQVEIGEQTSDD